MATKTQINANLILKATETDLAEEFVNETFWEGIATDSSLEDDHMMMAPESVMTKKSERAKMGAKYVEFGLTKQLEGEGTYEGGVLSGNEEPISSYDNAVYFTTIRHGVPFPLKELDAHYNQAFNLLQRRQKALAIWNARVAEQWHWQAFVYGSPDEVNSVHGTDSPQNLHPTIYTLDASSVTQVTWSATEATYEDNVATAIGDQISGDNISVDNVWRMEQEAANQNIRPVPVSIDGAADALWIWVYPRASRVRLKNTFKQFFLDGDVRGPNNRTIRGDKFKVGQMLFVESAWIPRLLDAGDTTVTLEESWAWDSATNTRKDNRAAVRGLVHAILGADALCLAEPETIQYDFERTDYKAKEGIGTYRLMGSRRGETFDDRTSVTDVLNQSSMIAIEYDG